MDAKQVARKLAAVIEADSSRSDKEIWINPSHWKTMGPEKQAIIVSLWHKDNNFSKKFPFKSVRREGETVNVYDIGIVFSNRGDLFCDALENILKTFKIPHSKTDRKSISKSRENFKKVLNGKK